VITVDEERCKHEMVLRDCSWCKGLPDLDPSWLDEPAEPEVVTSPSWVPARFAGRCSSKKCHQRFEEGDMVRMTEEGWICNHAQASELDGGLL
jgi:hypothetical protein